MYSEITEITEIKEERSPRHDHVCPTVRHETPWRGDETLAPRTNHSFRGWILYDGACRSCAASRQTIRSHISPPRFPLSSAANKLDHGPARSRARRAWKRCAVLTADGRGIGGADAVVFLARQIWWAWPLPPSRNRPAMHKLLDRGYRWIAAHRGIAITLRVICRRGDDARAGLR